MRLLLAFLSLTALASAEDRRLALVNVSSPRGFQEIATILRTVADIPALKVDSEHPGLDPQGSPAYLDAAEWLVHQLDKPAGWQPSDEEKANPSTREYRLPPAEPASVLRIFYLPETTTDRGMQETQTILRSVLDVQKIFTYSPLHLLAYRGTASELDAVEWLLPALEVRAASAPYTLPDGKPSDVLRVFPLPQDASPPQIQQILRELRTKPIGVVKVFPRTAPPAIAVRGTAAQIEQAERVIPPINSPSR